MRVKKVNIVIIILLMFLISMPKCLAYYATTIEKGVRIGTISYEKLIFGFDKEIYGNNVPINLTVSNPNPYNITYTLSLPNNVNYQVDGASVTSYVVPANGSKSHVIMISGASGSSLGITIKMTAPYSENYVETVALDIEEPTVAIISTNNVASSQTVTLSCTDAVGVTSYYFGTSNSPSENDYTKITSTTNMSNTKTVSSAAPYYLYCKDAAGNTNSVSKNFYKTTFTMENGTVSPTNVITMSGNGFALPTPTAITGYETKGSWYTNNSYSTAIGKYGSTYTPNSSVTLYSTSTPSTFNLTYDCSTNGGTGDTTVAVNYGSTADLTKTCTKNGWTLVGWNTDSTATDKINSYTMPKNDATLYAIYSKTVTITFKANGCTTEDGTVKPILYNNESSATVTVPKVSMNSGWTTLGASSSASSTSNGTAMESNMSITGISSASTTVTRYYNCYKPEITRVAKFNCNGGTGTVPDQTCKIEAVYNGTTQETSCNVTFPSSGCENSVWDFQGWNSNSSSTSGLTGSISISSDKTYYAIWKKSVTVTFKANKCTTADGTVEFDLYNGETSSTITVPTATMKTNWETLGASSSPSSTSQGLEMDESTTVTIASTSKTATYYYNCKKNIKVTFNANSCTTGDGTVNKPLYNGATSTTVTVPTKDMVNSSWETLGASSSPSSTSSGVGMGSSMSISSIDSSTVNITRYYNCYKEVLIDFYANYCTTDGIAVKKNIYNGATSATVSMPTNYTAESGRTIEGISLDGSSHSASSTLTVPIADSMGFAYFICTRNFDVVFKANGCATADKTVSKTLYSRDDNFTVSVPAPSMKTGWTNIGAASSSSATTGSTSTVSVSTSGYYTSSTFYYTCNKPSITYTASFASAASGASVTAASKSCTIPAVYNGETQDTSCSITLPTTGYSYIGWTFNGWGTSSTSQSGSTGAVDLSSDKTYYATWKKPAITRTATFSCNGGTGSVSDET
ncbi:MAG: InlB B-repeat-containing protein, partial [Bacilli bacterium]|nr:InlB B-repeat-containing protein [Bacilli bacterium]